MGKELGSPCYWTGWIRRSGHLIVESALRINRMNSFVNPHDYRSNRSLAIIAPAFAG